MFETDDDWDLDSDKGTVVDLDAIANPFVRMGAVVLIVAALAVAWLAF